jgi:hypothetical protein
MEKKRGADMAVKNQGKCDTDVKNKRSDPTPASDANSGKELECEDEVLTSILKSCTTVSVIRTFTELSRNNFLSAVSTLDMPSHLVLELLSKQLSSWFCPSGYSTELGEHNAAVNARFNQVQIMQ